MRRLTPFVFVLALLSACGKPPAPPAPVADEATLRSTAGGDVVGFVTPDGAHGWLNIPFAAPPVGDLRWRAPRPAATWDGVRDATAFSPRCAQISNRLNESEGVKPGVILGSEDCLYLNVYAPPDAEGKTLPVMVWIHGGANVWGRASSYEGSRLALNEDVIIVTAQYRVGPFGFFAHPSLRDDAETDRDLAANFALLDLAASLEWVRDNIAAFGGDPSRVTIFGESAGGANVAALLASPFAEGLFHRAIIQSGSFDSATADLAEREHKNSATEIANRLGAASADDLRGVSVDALFDAYRDGAFEFLDMPTMIQDGVSLPGFPLRDAFVSTQLFHAVPIMTGTNRDEMKFFNSSRPDLIKRRFFLFPAPRDPEYYDAMNDYLSRIWRIRSVDEPAAMMAEADHSDVYGYRFDWDESGKFLLSDFSKLIGAGHAVEIPFVFNRFEFFGPRYDKIFFHKKTAESREALSRTMGAYWASFARDGAPTATSGPGWPQWSRNGGSLIVFDSAEDGGVAISNAVATMEDLIAELKSDPRLSAAQRCSVAAEITVWLNGLGTQIERDLDCPGQES